MSESLQDIKRGNRYDGTEWLYVSDETNCVQWFHAVVVTAQEDDGPFVARCEEHGDPETWRRVYVKT